MTPLMFRKLMATDRFNPPASPGCDIRIGGGGVGSALVTKALTRFGDTINLYHGFASSELVMSVLASRLRSGDDALWLEPVADRTVQIVDESGHECSLGQEGDLRIRTTELDWQSYLDDDEASARVFRDGFFYPGDRAVRRADGRIHVLGRVADVLNVQGDKVAVGPIEQRIKQYLDAEEVCAFSRRNNAGQDELVIAIQADGTPPKQKLDAISREFSGFEKVRFSVLREFPRTDTGMEKIHRMALRKLVFSEADSRASGGGDDEVFE